jgi:uncharacterized protein (DUF4415 family)
MAKPPFPPAPPRRPADPRKAAEDVFKPKPPPLPEAPQASAPSVPGAKEQVTLRLDRDVLERFQEDGPGWQDRVNAALRKAAGLAG